MHVRAANSPFGLDSPAGGERTLSWRAELESNLTAVERNDMSSVQLTRDIYDAFGRGDIPAVLGCFAPDMEWHPAEGHAFRPDGSPWVGRDEIAEGFFAQIGEAWSTFTVTPRRFHDAGDTVVVEGRYTGVLRESRESIDAQFCHIWTARDGKMTTQQYMDTAQLQHAVAAGVAVAR